MNALSISETLEALAVPFGEDHDETTTPILDGLAVIFQHPPCEYLARSVEG